VVRDLLSGMQGVWQVVYEGRWCVATRNGHFWMCGILGWRKAMRQLPVEKGREKRKASSWVLCQRELHSVMLPRSGTNGLWIFTISISTRQGIEI